MTKEKQIHPNSRKATYMGRSIVRTDKVQRKKAAHKASKKMPVIERLQWFQSQLDDRESYTADEVHAVVQQYLVRYDVDNPLNLVNTRNSFAKFLLEAERDEYTNGMDLPDMTDPLKLKAFKQWNGDYSSINQLSMTVIKRK